MAHTSELFPEPFGPRMRLSFGPGVTMQWSYVMKLCTSILHTLPLANSCGAARAGALEHVDLVHLLDLLLELDDLALRDERELLLDAAERAVAQLRLLHERLPARGEPVDHRALRRLNGEAVHVQRAVPG